MLKNLGIEEDLKRNRELEVLEFWFWWYESLIGSGIECCSWIHYDYRLSDSWISSPSGRIVMTNEFFFEVGEIMVGGGLD